METNRVWLPTNLRSLEKVRIAYSNKSEGSVQSMTIHVQQNGKRNDLQAIVFSSTILDAIKRTQQQIERESRPKE